MFYGEPVWLLEESTWTAKSRRTGNDRGTPTDDDSLCRKVEELSDVVTRQRNIINVLTQRLSFMLFMFGIDDGRSHCGDVAQVNANVQTVSGSEKYDDSSLMRTHVTHMSSTESGGSTTNSSAKNSFRNAVLATVYSERQNQESRAKNFVISGLPSGTEDDKTVVEQLCQNDLNLCPSIRSCRRLGRKVVGKNQPVLVSVSTAHEASAVISCAKKLRQSADPMVNSQVFINVDLTKAQAAAAYEQRCLRRKKLQDRLNQTTRLSTIPVVTEDPAVIHSVDLDISRPAKSSDSMQKLSDEGDAAGVNFPASATQAV